MSYFEDYCNRLNVLVKEQEGSRGLRECQIGAFWAVRAHYTSSDHPALVVMPTGSGKTAVMMLSAFGLEASRVLVVTPALILRDQTAERFRSLDDLTREKVLPTNVKKPKVRIQKGRVTSVTMWNKLRSYDVVVATPHTVSPEQHKDIVPPPDDLFDVVFFDEAHHTPAPTWDELLETFNRSKCILLTATPFRQDKRKLRADMVYNYPLGRAIDKGIYRVVEYHPVKALPPAHKDSLLCKKAKELLTKEKEEQHRTKILIRTDRVQKCKPLVELYASEGIVIDEVNYEKSLQENEAVLEKIRSDELDGVVCVGMLGEGLDIPELKIAVLHDPPQSLPFTLQFVGRISRPARGQIGEAHVIANPDDVKGQMRDLYRQDTSWRDLVPKLVDEVVGQVAELGKFHQAASISGDLDIDPKGIAPFFSARLYEVDPQHLDLTSKLDLGNRIAIPFAEYLYDGNFLALITETENRPPWAESLALYSVRYDLHLYYHHGASKTLFESTTSNGIATQIRRQIVTGGITRRPGEELIRVMQSQESVDYLMVGLANVLGRVPSLPAYKILMGKEVQGAVRPTEGRVFTPGHALARISSVETRGIGSFQGRVWSIRRASLMEFKDWCDAIGSKLVKDKASTLPGMGFLPNPQRIEEFPETPIAVAFNYRALGFPLWLVTGTPGGEPISAEMSEPEFELVTSADRQTLRLRLHPNAGDSGVLLTYAVVNNRWIVEGEITCSVCMDTGDQIATPTLEEFLLEYPPSIYLGNGVVINGELFQAKRSFDALPDDCIQKGVNWRGCDITLELVDEQRGAYPAKATLAIHDWLEEILTGNSSRDAIVLKDHAKGEIADFVVVEPRSQTISFYHCKAARDSKPGARVRDLRDVSGQVLRSITWIRRPYFLTELARRSCSETRPNSRLVKGTEESLDNLATEFHANEWKYQVVIVHPGLDCKKATSRTNTNILLLNCFEWLSNMDASLSIMGQ